MGMDFLIHILATRQDRIDYDHAHTLIDSETDANWHAFLVESVEEGSLPHKGGFEVNSIEDARKELHGLVNALKRELDDGLEVIKLPFGEWTLYVTGGSSWGDSPTALYDIIQDLHDYPEILEALSFEWPAKEDTDGPA